VLNGELKFAKDVIKEFNNKELNSEVIPMSQSMNSRTSMK